MMTPAHPVTLRPMRAGDIPALSRIFYDAIQVGAARHYDAAQRRAWCPAPPDPLQWADRLSAQSVTVAEIGARLAGFMSLRADGHIDLAFVAPDSAGQGIGSRLLSAVEREARHWGIPTLSVEASLGARALFAREGWVLLREQIVHRDGIALTNFAIEKRLAPR